MNYTKNYRLPQWVKEDRIMMDDFNAAMSGIENGLTKTESTANSAKANADQAVATANAAAAAKPYVVGTYTGDGEAAKSINLGFKPSFLIISGMRGVLNAIATDFVNYFAITGGTALTSRVSLTDTGFTVYPNGPSKGSYPDLDESGRRYDYIAFK